MTYDVKRARRRGGVAAWRRGGVAAWRRGCGCPRCARAHAQRCEESARARARRQLSKWRAPAGALTYLVVVVVSGYCMMLHAIHQWAVGLALCISLHHAL
jgi:hypothetical protein